MPNRMLQVEEVQKRVNAGFPNGCDIESRPQLINLLARIDELETALVPFARVGATLSPHEPETRDVYTKDVANAFAVLDRRQAWVAPVEEPGIPA